MNLTLFFTDVYRPLRLRGRSPNTSRLYHCTIRAFGRWLHYEPTLDDLTDLTISRYLEHRAALRSAYTAEKERTQLLALWRFASDRRLLDSRPCVPPAPLPERTPTAWTVNELRSLRRAAAATRGSVGDVPAGVWYAALVSVLWESAERIGAVLACQPEAFGAPHLTVAAEHRKGRRRDRVYTLTAETCELLERARGRDRLFDWPWSREYLWLRWKDVVARAGLRSTGRCGFHALRRSAATHFTAAGGDATRLLDHDNPRTTRRWYLDPRMVNAGPLPCDVLPRLSDE